MCAEISQENELGVTAQLKRLLLCWSSSCFPPWCKLRVCDRLFIKWHSNFLSFKLRFLESAESVTGQNCWFVGFVQATSLWLVQEGDCDIGGVFVAVSNTCSLYVLDLVGGPRLKTKTLCSGLGGFWSVQLLAFSALRSCATKVCGDASALDAAGPRRI